jgi:hypothetical protein
MTSCFPFFVGKEMRVFVTQTIETIRIEGRAGTGASDLKTLELTVSSLNNETLPLPLDKNGSADQTRVLFKED